MENQAIKLQLNNISCEAKALKDMKAAITDEKLKERLEQQIQALRIKYNNLKSQLAPPLAHGSGSSRPDLYSE